jgi:hypothetical protein
MKMINFNTIKRGLIFLSLVLVFILSGSYGFSQCLEKDLVSLNLNNDEELEINLSNFSGNLTSYQLRLYNYETTNDFISVNLTGVQGSNIEFNRNEKKIIIKSIPAGDYLVIFENSACQNIYVGEGFSGFPNSGIRIE